MRRTALLIACALLLSACGSEQTPPADTVSVSAPSVTQDPQPSQDSEDSPQSDPLTILVIGADRDTGAQRADMILLVRVDEERDHASAMSIHRDTWVEVPGHGEAKINAAFAYGGEELLAETVDSLYSADIDHTAVVDFDAFIALSEILGPLSVETADGPVLLEGEEALDFVRERYSLPGGDFDRVRRQQAYIAAAAQAVRGADPAELMEIGALAGEYITVDGETGMSAQILLLDLIAQTAGVDPVFFSAPHAGTGWVDGQSIVVSDEEATAVLARAYEADDVDEWLERADPETLDSRPVN